MIRFKTIEPETAAKTTQPAEAPRPAPAQFEPRPAEADEPAVKSKGLTRKTPLRARKPDVAPLFDEKAPAADSEAAG
ncbi:hypothetical protein DWF00_07225 [Bosea caraganae]|uniref:Uncharacterized protein n=1 Tax=Bosea caraganae TaxID=2763117 RepID=A0A370L224_9HYPH|nr:hypothetical protein [Bosea caraganae]RDJ21010.1 hypothetical protein DWE98_22020 [Bosea caraganae]RDJ28509.1 hypothetical protein DWF00_07225 [Bosea caraganae]